MKRCTLERVPTDKIVLVPTDDPDSALAVIIGREEMCGRNGTGASKALAAR
jgi:hypothetical protein